MSSLKVAVLCGQSPRHLHVANRICEATDVVAIVQEAGGNKATKLTKLLKQPRRLLQKSWRWLRDRRRYHGNPEAEYFFKGSDPTLSRPDLARYFPDINDPGVVDLMDELEPDLIMVFGTSLIRSDLLSRGRMGLVNLHGGLSPQYRGADCTFWALYNNQPEQIGCTIHFINAGIDTGNLIAHVCPPVRAGDTELELFWRSVEESSEVYVELIRRLGDGEQFGQLQNEKGHLYQVKDRGYRHEKRLDKTLASGMLKDADLPLRVTWFTKDL